MDDLSAREYTSEEVNRIMRRALKKEQSDRISHQDLLHTAKEMGLDPAAVEAAIKQEQTEYQTEREEAEQFAKRKESFKQNLWSYFIVISFLMLINCFTGGFSSGDWWFQWPALGWGIAIAFHLKSVYYPEDEEEEEGKAKSKRGHHRRRPSCCP